MPKSRTEERTEGERSSVKAADGSVRVWASGMPMPPCTELEVMTSVHTAELDSQASTVKRQDRT